MSFAVDPYAWSQDPCPGEGKCHGCLSWCAWCDTVTHTCDARPGDCFCHPPCPYPGCGVLNCWEHRDYGPEAVCKGVLES